MTRQTEERGAHSGGMRIALVDPGDFTPAYDEELARGLRRLGHEVVLIGKHGGPLSSLELGRPTFYALLANRRARALPASLARTLKGVHHIVDMARLIVLLRRMRPDVIHFQWMPLPLVDARFLGALRRIAPLALTVHDSEPYQGATNRLMALGFTRLVRGADAVIAHTRSTAAQLERLGLDAARQHRVAHGLLHAPAEPEARRAPAPDGRLRLLQFGKIKAYKGVDVLIEAVGLLDPETRRRLHLRVVGAPYIDTRPLLERVRDLGLSDCIEFRLGFVPVDEMRACFAEADLLMLPYRQIDASGVLMAAIARGLPVVASRIGDFAELLEHGREALLVEPGAAPALAAAIAALARSPERLAAMADAMGRTRDEIPSWDQIAARTVAVYDQVRGRRLPAMAPVARRSAGASAR